MNKEKNHEYWEKWYYENGGREKVKEYKKKYYLEHKDKYKKQKRKSKEEQREYWRKWYNEKGGREKVGKRRNKNGDIPVKRTTNKTVDKKDKQKQETLNKLEKYLKNYK